MPYNDLQQKDSQNGLEDIVDIAIADAITQISRSTGLSKQQALSFVQQKYTQQKMTLSAYNQAQILSVDESHYIGSLFN